MNISINLLNVPLGALCPVINGVPLEDARVEIIQDDAQKTIGRYTAPGLNGGAFGIEIRHEPDGRWWLRYRVEGLPQAISLDSFGVRFESVENLRAFLRNGYFSWDSSLYLEPEAMQGWAPDEPRPETGYAMTQLLPRHGAGSVVMGFDRHDRFQHIFTFDTRRAPPTLTVLTLWDRKERAGLSQCESEWLVILEHPQVEEALREWARLVAQASPVPPRLGLPLIGWCSWYNLYTHITEENILAHLHGVAQIVRREALPMRIFQIDDGFTPEMGDWLCVKPQFPRGMKPLLDDVRTAGFTPGLWIAPFMVGNHSYLYRDHPEWVVRDRQTGRPLAQMALYGEFRWGKRSEEHYILDATHPDAFDYLRQVFRTWRRDWGCDYFKTDFMYFGSEHGPERAIWHTPGLTRIEIWRRVAEMIREEIGDALWLGCGCPLWASVGLVDGIRIGRDVGVEWQGERSAQSLLCDQATRNFTNGILWQNDPDCILLREQFHHLSEAELRSLAIYAGMAGGVVMTSDALDELSPARLRLWKLLLNPNWSQCHSALLGQSAIVYEPTPADCRWHPFRHVPRAVDPVLVQVRTPVSPEGGAQTTEGALFIFNTGEVAVQRSYALDTLGLPGRWHVFDWTANHAWPAPVEQVAVRLSPHDGALLFVSRNPFLAVPDRLP